MSKATVVSRSAGETGGCRPVGWNQARCGSTSAGYWWARVAAALLVRLFYYILSLAGDQDALLYADDLFTTAGTKQEIVDIGAMLLIWEALGTPWKWRKFRGGCSCNWIGYWVDFENYALGISRCGEDWVIGWVEKTLVAGTVEMADFRAVLGRLGFAVGALDYLKPFLSPLYAWMSSVNHLGRMTLPWSVAFVLRYIAEELRTERRCMKVRPRMPSLGPVFRADAKAAGQTVRIGGWECRGGTPPARARWFAVILDRANAPWAFSRGEPFRTTAAIELFASLISFMVFVDEESGNEKGTLNLSGMTDNSGNTSAHVPQVSADSHHDGDGCPVAGERSRVRPPVDSG